MSNYTMLYTISYAVLSDKYKVLLCFLGLFILRTSVTFFYVSIFRETVKMKEKHKHSKNKKDKKSKRHKEKKKCSSSSSGSESDEWVEQQTTTHNSAPGRSREDWMSMTGLIQTYSKDDTKRERKDTEKKHIDSYNPSTSTRELNPYWKDGGTGLPQTSEEIRKSQPFKRPSYSDDLYTSSSSKFKRPSNDSYYKSRKDNFGEESIRDSSGSSIRSNGFTRSKDFKKPVLKEDDRKCESFKRPSKDEEDYHSQSGTSLISNKDYHKSSSSGWKKSRLESDSKHATTDSRELLLKPELGEKHIDFQSEQNKPLPVDGNKYLSDEKMNKLAAKIVKAEIMGDNDLVKKMKRKLEEARAFRKENPDAGKSEDLPEDIMLTSTNSRGDSRPLTKSVAAGDPRSKGGKRKAQTHSAGERTSYFSNDDRLSLSEMFEQEKYGSNYEDESQFAKIATKHTNPNDDLEDIFTEQISKNVNRAKEDEKNKQRAIREHQKLERVLEGCEYCVGSSNMKRHLMVSLGSKVYLALPSQTSLTEGHCVISTVQHAASVTAVDEDVWEEITNFRKALVALFASREQSVLFYETCRGCGGGGRAHVCVQCVPLPRDVARTAPAYFRKALLECEAEWALNHKLVSLKGKDVRRGVPRGLPYFWVDFGMEPGFAHVIEDQQLFPSHFAEEIICGMLELEPGAWRRRPSGDQQRRSVSQFLLTWKHFDTVSVNKL